MRVDSNDEFVKLSAASDENVLRFVGLLAKLIFEN